MARRTVGVDPTTLWLTDHQDNVTPRARRPGSDLAALQKVSAATRGTTASAPPASTTPSSRLPLLQLQGQASRGPRRRSAKAPRCRSNKVNSKAAPSPEGRRWEPGTSSGACLLLGLLLGSSGSDGRCQRRPGAM